MSNIPTSIEVLIKTMATIVGTMATSVPLKWIVFDEANFEKQDSI